MPMVVRSNRWIQAWQLPEWLPPVSLATRWLMVTTTTTTATTTVIPVLTTLAVIDIQAQARGWALS